MIEVELKVALPQETREKLQEKLQSMEFLGIVHNSDIYYDTAEFDFLRQATFIRVRNDNLLQIKFNESVEKVHGQVTERAFPLLPGLEQAAAMNSLLGRFLPVWDAASSFEEARLKNRLIELAHIENKREAYSSNSIYVSVDHLESLGDFLEIEANYEEGSDTSSTIDTLLSFTAGLNLQRIKTGYVELWLRIQNPQAYLLGKYLL
jgi:adenylate cyclase class IV